MSEQAVINRLWCRIILEELTRLGVHNVCIAPGSRSTPLALEADANTRLCIHPHFDERGLGYLALGLAKASQQPVAVIVTSGTAVANLLPAIAESKLTGEKLVVLTADRPVELIACGANQAIVQAGIFSHHVTHAVNFPSPTTAISPGWLLTTIDQAMSYQSRDGGAIHLNCPFPEPLYSDQQLDLAIPYLAGVQDWVQSGTPYCQPSSVMVPESSAAPRFSLLEAGLLQRKGLVIIGSLDLAAALQAKVFAQTLGWPVLCDPQSGVTSQWAYFDVWLQHPRLAQMLSPCEVVIQFGTHFVSKRLNRWLHSHIQSGCRYVYISPDFARDNPHHLPQQHVVAEVSDWVAHHMPREGDVGHHDDMNVSQNHAHGWANDLLPVISAIPRIIAQRANQVAGIAEMDVAISIIDLVPQADLFIGNSLIVRLVDMLGQHQDRAVYSNRGASGIDGLVATAVGVQRATQQPMILLMGDTSLLYDLNSLALLTRTVAPFVIVVTNNDGGAIFDLLPVPAEQKVTLYQMPHGYQFRHAAQQFGLGYLNPQDMETYRRGIEQHVTGGQGGLIVEIITPPGQAAMHLEQVVNDVKAL